MELRYIPIENIHDTKLNMRHDRRPPDVSDILPTVRAKGILQPLLVRPYGVAGEEAVEIVAGRRRYWCGRAIAEEQGNFAPLPCAVMAPGDDAAAVEASLIENAARRDADPMTEHETFVRLIKEGRKLDEIATTFGLTERVVEQRLALGNLLPKIREAYRREEVDDQTAQYLTMASKQQQKAWLALFEEDEAHVPMGYQLKQWLFGGTAIATKAALFPLERYSAPIVSDLFGEEQYFADADEFWELQNAAIAEKREALLARKWSEVVVLEPGERFDMWSYEKTPKTKGGKVFVTVNARGEVEVHEGWLPRKAARKVAKEGRASGETAEACTRPVMTQAMKNYLELHRHAAARNALLASPVTAMRLLVVHTLVPSGNWQVKPDPQRARSPEIAASVENSPAQKGFAAERETVAELLKMKESPAASVEDDQQTACLFLRLLELSEAEFARVAAFAMAETLAAGSVVVDVVGSHLKHDPQADWQPDETFFALLKDRTSVNAMLAEVAGETVAKANAGEKLKTQKQIIRDHIQGANGRPKVEGWLPGWMEFPFRAYGNGCSSVGETAKLARDIACR